MQYAPVQSRASGVVGKRVTRRRRLVNRDYLSRLASQILGRKVELTTSRLMTFRNVQHRVVERHGELVFAVTGARLTPTDRAELEHLSALGLIDREVWWSPEYDDENALTLSATGWYLLDCLEAHGL